MPSTAVVATLSADPNVDAFTAGFEVGIFAVLVCIVGLVGVSAIRRLVDGI